MMVLFERYLLDRRRGMTGWAIGIVAYCLLIVAFYPSVRDSTSSIVNDEKSPAVNRASIRV